jgi:hypothetical protein
MLIGVRPSLGRRGQRDGGRPIGRPEPVQLDGPAA